MVFPPIFSGGQERKKSECRRKRNRSNLRLKEITDGPRNSLTYQNIMEQGKEGNSYYTSYLFLYEFLRHMEKMLSQTDYKNPTKN